MPTFIMHYQPKDCLHKYFCAGDEVEFDLRSCKETFEGFPVSPWRGSLLLVGCQDMLVKVPGYEKNMLVYRPGTLVRLIATGTIRDNSPSGCRYITV
jgi:hypothetical protein